MRSSIESLLGVSRTRVIDRSFDQLHREPGAVVIRVTPPSSRWAMLACISRAKIWRSARNRSSESDRAEPLRISFKCDLLLEVTLDPLGFEDDAHTALTQDTAQPVGPDRHSLALVVFGGGRRSSGLGAIMLGRSGFQAACWDWRPPPGDAQLPPQASRSRAASSLHEGVSARRASSPTALFRRPFGSPANAIGLHDVPTFIQDGQ